MFYLLISNYWETTKNEIALWNVEKFLFFFSSLSWRIIQQIMQIKVRQIHQDSEGDKHRVFAIWKPGEFSHRNILDIFSFLLNISGSKALGILFSKYRLILSDFNIGIFSAILVLESANHLSSILKVEFLKY